LVHIISPKDSPIVGTLSILTRVALAFGAALNGSYAGLVGEFERTILKRPSHDGADLDNVDMAWFW